LRKDQNPAFFLKQPGRVPHDSSPHAPAAIERPGCGSGIYNTFIRTDSHIIIISHKPRKTTGERRSKKSALSRRLPGERAPWITSHQGLRLSTRFHKYGDVFPPVIEVQVESDRGYSQTYRICHLPFAIGRLETGWIQ